MLHVSIPEFLEEHFHAVGEELEVGPQSAADRLATLLNGKTCSYQRFCPIELYLPQHRAQNPPPQDIGTEREWIQALLCNCTIHVNSCYLPPVEEDEGVLEVAHVVERLRLDHHRLGYIANANVLALFSFNNLVSCNHLSALLFSHSTFSF